MTKLINQHNKSVTPPAKPLPHARLHDLRHLHATTLLMSRVTSDASFRRIREPVWPAVLFTAGQAAAGRAMW